MAGFGDSVPHAEPIVKLNIGFPFDYGTGYHVITDRGEAVCNGGLFAVNGICGRGNTNKTTLSLDQLIRPLLRYTQYLEPGKYMNIYSTEFSLDGTRVNMLAEKYPEYNGEDLCDVETGSVVFTSAKDILGNEWFDKIRKLSESIYKNKNKTLYTTPFKNNEKELIKIPEPLIIFEDSMSAMPLDVTEKIFDENEVGSAKATTSAARRGAALTQMIDMIPGVVNRGGIYSIWTAHVGDKVVLDPRELKQKKLAFLKNGVTLKRVPENYTMLMNNLWYILISEPLGDKGAPEYPSKYDVYEDGKSTDLQRVSVVNTRGKGGSSGSMIDIVISQSRGVLWGLTAYHYLKNKTNREGIENINSHTGQYLAIYPDVKFGRTRIYDKILEDPLLERACTITAELYYGRITKQWDRSYDCTPTELYEDIKKLGYDWNQLLDTRDYYVFKEVEDKYPQPFLSTFDLLRIRKGEYKPYWM